VKPKLKKKWKELKKIQSLQIESSGIPRVKKKKFTNLKKKKNKKILEELRL